jgi:2-methylcitrate dehydratase PrpD
MIVADSATEAPARAKPDAGFTEALAEWACRLEYDDVPARARRIAELALFDWYAVAWAGAPEAAPRLLRQTFAAVLAPSQPAHVIGESARADTVTAALLNGTAGHVLDYDDVHNALPGHATAPVAPAVLALAEARKASGRDFLAAFVAGFEIACRMGVFAGPGLFRRGYHGSTTAGAIGAAAACSRLAGAGKTEMRRAFGLAATQAGGLQATVGTMAKCFNVGKAAQNGLVAALLAENGFECAENVLEAPRGYGAVFADGGASEAALAPAPGGWHLYRNLFKHHASCFMTHAPLEALKAIRTRAMFRPDEVVGLVVRVEPHFHRIVLTPPPNTGLEAKFNLQFCLALALAGADTGAMASFNDATARRADLHALAARCTVETVADMHFESAAVELRLRDGRNFAATHDSGEPESDLDVLEDRMRRKAAALLDAEKADRLARAFLALEAQPSVAAAMAELHR